MTEHTKTDGLPGLESPGLPPLAERARPRNERMNTAKVECNACPVLCQISEGRAGACDRYANQGGTLEAGETALVPFAGRSADNAGRTDNADTPAAEAVPAWSGDLLLADQVFVTGVGSSTTYPDYKPAPFIVGSQVQGVDMVTVVTEGIFSYCSFKVKIDTDRFLGAEQANVRCKGEVVGHVTTAEYGSQMLSLGGVHHLTGGSKKEGRITAEMMQALGNKQAVEFTIDGGSQIVIQAGRAPIVNGVEEQRMRVGCGSAAVGIFARQLFGLADEQLRPVETEMPAEVRRIVERIGENCEPSLASVLFLAGAGGSLRAGVTENPVLLTRSIKQALVNVTCGGAPAYVWPGGGITVMADVLRMPDNSFGTVPTPAIVAPIEFSMRRSDYADLGGHVDQIRSLAEVLSRGAWHNEGAPQALQWQRQPDANPWPLGRPPLLG